MGTSVSGSDQPDRPVGSSQFTGGNVGWRFGAGECSSDRIIGPSDRDRPPGRGVVDAVALHGLQHIACGRAGAVLGVDALKVAPSAITRITVIVVDDD
jgi:hypothetical protein